MKPIPYLMISASVFSLMTAQAEEFQDAPSSFSLFDEIEQDEESPELASSANAQDPEWDESFFENEESSPTDEVAVLEADPVEGGDDVAELALLDDEENFETEVPQTALSENAEALPIIAISEKAEAIPIQEAIESIPQEVAVKEIAMAEIEEREQVQPEPLSEKALAKTTLIDEPTKALHKEKAIAASDAPIDKAQEPAYTLAIENPKQKAPVSVDFKQVFSGSPIIYTVLLIMSICAFAIWLFSFLSISASGKMPESLLKNIRNKLNSNQYDDAIALCLQQDSLLCKMLVAGITARKQGAHVIMDSMRSEGKRSSVSFWQKMALLNDIAVIAPMIGLLGTVLGMFYAFYDLNRSVESISSLFDGLGISVGTTVAGLIVAILAMMFYSLTKYRLVRKLAMVENEAQTFAALMDSKRE